MLKVNSIYILVSIIQRQGPTTGFCKEGDDHSNSIALLLIILASSPIKISYFVLAS